jgi:hypothetical protein
VKKTQRKVIVLASLVGLLTLTSALLLVMAPPPPSADAYSSLSATDRREFLRDVFKTAVQPRDGQWKYVYIHHSATTTGSAEAFAQSAGGLGDHFVIGNGEGAGDGVIEIGQRWNHQVAAAAPAGADTVSPDCITICLVGDFDQATPTPTQLRRLSQLVTTLQTEFRITGDRVVLLGQPGAAAGIGRYFPQAVFRDQILP